MKDLDKIAKYERLIYEYRIKAGQSTVKDKSSKSTDYTKDIQKIISSSVQSFEKETPETESDNLGLTLNKKI